jgi:hypothetical protein
MKKIILMLIVLSIMGCATTENYQLPDGVDDSNLATLHVYRTDTFFHSLDPEKPYIYLGDRVIAKLGTGQAKIVKVPAGKHRLSVRQPILFMPSYESDYFEYQFEAGMNYYVRYSMEFGEVILAGSNIAVIGSSHFSLTNKENYIMRR